MDCATMLNYTMLELWEADDESLTPVECLALAAYVKTHKHTNPHNAFDVIAIVWPETKWHVETRGPDETLHYATFPDKSQCLIISQRGIGSALELL